MIEITPRRLFGIGIVCFSIIAATNIFSLLINYSIAPLYVKISSVFNIIFQIALAMSFAYLRKNAPMDLIESKEVVSSDEIDDVLKELDNHGFRNEENEKKGIQRKMKRRRRKKK